ncbi:transcriptional regulator, GntR family [Roseomonas rosea]|uniref:Transcriptional regulator, GntR family n=1 Tax=Muricoccus roseus TaxID=198092 RepID=A0A1M6PSH7_9PROT|nr:GntR family transcriptional regulator [Roseomonas rosea]SHK10934.1 transcriptional regulator, GntR family [Roseomonas rosea]
MNGVGATKRLADTTLISQAVQSRLKSDILDGQFTPGSKLGTAMLQERYDSSVGTLREALSHLLSEGLVEMSAGRGYRVAPVSRADLLDVSALYIELEERAVVDSVRHGDAEWETEIVASFHRLSRIEALPREERIRRSSEWLACHRAFHLALVAACRSRWVLRVRAGLYDHMERYRLISQKHRPLSIHKRREHELLRDAALGRQAEEVGTLLRRHLAETTDTVLRYAPQFMPEPGEPGSD